MTYKNSTQQFRSWYVTLLRLYPQPYRERFAEPMTQTFNDLLQERAQEEKRLFSFALWLFAETSVGILKENITFMITQNIARRMFGWAAAIALILLVPLAAMQFTEEINWSLFDFGLIGALLFGLGFVYELVTIRARKSKYRAAFGLGLGAAFLLVWVNGAVGLIGHEGNPANLMYGAVFAVGLVGSLFARFKPRGMAYTLFATALTQMLVPVIALIIWPPVVVSWGALGVFGVFVLNAFFAILFVASALLFRRASVAHPA